MREPIQTRGSGLATGAAMLPFALTLGLLAACAAQSMAAGAPKPGFGPNVLVFSPSMPAAAIQSEIDKVYAVQRNSEFGPARNALLFLPGNYNVDVPVGFYTEVLGLGPRPTASRSTAMSTPTPAWRTTTPPVPSGARLRAFR